MRKKVSVICVIVFCYVFYDVYMRICAETCLLDICEV